MLNLPVRIQRRRTKGWRLPKGAKCVTRPGKWGNPLKLISGALYVDAGYRRQQLSPFVLVLSVATPEELIAYYRRLWSGETFANPDLQYHADRLAKLDLGELRGLDLACFCGVLRLGQPAACCHAQVLIELANPLMI